MLLVLVAFCFGPTSHAATFEVKDPKRYIEIIDVVDGSMLKDVAAKIESLSRASSAPIDMLINSPGGMVMMGTSILDAMTVAQSRGVKFRCISGTLAASMAFITLAACDERYALPGTKLLFHPMSTGGKGRVRELLPALAEALEEEESLIKLMKDALQMNDHDFMINYLAETMWTATVLNAATHGKFIKIVDHVKGIDKLFVIERDRPFLFRINSLKSYPSVLNVLTRAGYITPADIAAASRTADRSTEKEHN